MSDGKGSAKPINNLGIEASNKTKTNTDGLIKKGPKQVRIQDDNEGESEKNILLSQKTKKRQDELEDSFDRLDSKISPQNAELQQKRRETNKKPVYMPDDSEDEDSDNGFKRQETIKKIPSRPKDSASRLDFEKAIKQMTETNANSELKYGDYIVLDIVGNKDYPRRITTNYRISTVVNAVIPKQNDYDSNCVFRIIPEAQYEMLKKVKNVINSNKIPDNFDVDYGNFISELQANVDIQNKVMGNSIRYGAKFQLIQESSKRFLSTKPADISSVMNCFKSGYIDNECFEFCFSEHPTSFTHFKFQECSSFQKEGEAKIRESHYIYLYNEYQEQRLYLCNNASSSNQEKTEGSSMNPNRQILLTQSYKTPLMYRLIRESNTFMEDKKVISSKIAMLTYSNDSYYLNVPQKLDENTKKLMDEGLSFQNERSNK